MKKFIKSIYSSIFKPPAVELVGIEKETFKNEIDFQNYRKIKYFSLLLILYLVPVIIFSDLSDLYNPNNRHYYHDFLNTLADLGFLLVTIFTAVINFALFHDRPGNIKIYQVFINKFYAFSILMLSSLNSVADQLTNGQFLVYLIGLLGTGILMNMSLKSALLIYALPHLVFLTGAIALQKDSSILAANITNSTLALIIGLFICFTFYKNKLKDFAGTLLIENQNRELITKSKSLELLTSELKTKNLELELERRQINLKNSQIESELEIAKRIQLQMIPKVPPFDRISVCYRPMEKLGGDFYDFISFKEKAKAGIFISDISGHGAPAAMMTSMVKSFILQAGEWTHSPSLFLSRLNLFLMDLSTELFITALYGIYDFSERAFTYANAGHNLPYIIGNNKIGNLPSDNKGIPLGILENTEAAAMHKDLTVILEENSKLLIYTDGLTDTISSYNMMEDFEEYELKRSLLSFSKLPPDEFVANLMRSLINFKGNEDFEDDICMICLQS